MVGDLTGDGDSARPTHVGAIVVLAAVLLVFLPGVFGSGFVSDDARFIRDNPAVLHPGGLSDWLRFFSAPETVDPANPQSIARPLRTLEFALDHALFGLSPIAFRLHGLLWHALSAVLCLALLRRLTGRGRAALAGALLWAVHPMQVESVAWISSRSDVAMGACVLGALLLALRSRGADRWLGLSLLLGLVAMLYKETAAVLPALVFAVFLVRPRQERPGEIAHALRAAAPFALVSAAYLAYRFALQEGAAAHTDVVLGGGTTGTLSTMFRAFGAYVGMVLLPVDPAWDWYLTPTRSLLAPSALVWLALHVGAVVLAVRWRRSQPLLTAAVCLFYFPLIPVANWPFSLGIPTAERFLYLPLLGLALLVAWAVRRAPRAAPPALVCVALLGVLSALRVPDWQTEDALMASALRHGHSPRGEDRRASDLSALAVARRREARDAGEADRDRLLAESEALATRALDHAHRALEQWRRFEGVRTSTSHVVVIPHSNAADLCLALDRQGEALWHAERAIDAGEDLFPEPHYNRARALLHFQRGAAALRSMQRAVELGFGADKAAAKRVFRLAGNACESLGQWQLAREAYRAAGALEGAEHSVAAVDARVADLLRTGDRLQRVQTLLADGRLREAEPMARELGSAWINLDVVIRVHAYRGVPVEWAATLESLTHEGSAGPALFWRGVCLEELGRDDEAADAYTRWLASGAESATPPGYDAERRARSALERIEEACPRWR